MSCCELARMVEQDAGHRLLAGRERRNSKHHVCQRSEWRHSAESVSVSAIDEEAARQSLSLGVEYRSRITSCTFPTARAAWSLFWARLPVQDAAPRFQSSTETISGQAKCQNKGRIFFYLVSPLSVLESVCRSASTLDFIYFTLLLLHFELPL